MPTKWRWMRRRSGSRSHLAQMETMLASGRRRGPEAGFPPPGEMNREANTIGSKYRRETRLAQVVVGIKGELEKNGEQIQNVNEVRPCS